MTVVLVAAAACVRYHPQPIAPGRTMEDFEARRLDSPELGRFLIANKEVETWPPAAWDLKSLTLAALYYHPDMDVARAQWGVARGGRITAGERPNPTLNPLMGYNATSPSERGHSLDPRSRPGAHDRDGRQARHPDRRRPGICPRRRAGRSCPRPGTSAAACAAPCSRSMRPGEMASLLADQEKLQTEFVRLLELQKEAGEVSTYDLTQARVALDESRLAAIEAARVREDAMARLAAALGLPRPALEGVTISFDAFRALEPDFPAGEVRRHAVLNRSDILAALAEYEASQSALKLEIAKQYPDISLGPDYQLDQTDSKWTIGLALDLPILSRNRGPIAEAEARREESAARFLALQSQVIGELDAAVEDCRAALLKSEAADDLVDEPGRAGAAARAQRELGEISKLELLGIRLELNAGAQARWRR